MAVTVINSRQQGITTKYIPASNTKPSRVAATAAGGSRLVMSYDTSVTQEEAHAKVAIALAEKLEWEGIMAQGAMYRDGYAFVFVARDGRAKVSYL